LKVSPAGSRRFSQSGLRPAGGLFTASVIASVPYTFTKEPIFFSWERLSSREKSFDQKSRPESRSH
jgi:hypothetical protein